jgi:nucleoporin GLE1
MCDPSSLFVTVPPPKEGAKYNGKMPSLFLYALNILVKIIVSQAISEVPANRGIAAPLSLLSHWVFSDPTLHWRGTSFIDILIAKFYVNCPALFGARGNENTAEGRAKLGWKAGVGEEVHMSQMTGMASTYAALATRTYTEKSQRENPIPPYHYWEAIAIILNTPAKDLSKTHLYILQALIQGYQAKFVEFYGDMAKMALISALYQLPECVNRKGFENAVGGLRVLAESTSKILAL